MPHRCLSDTLIVNLAMQLSSIMKHAAQTSTFSHKPIKSKTIAVETKSPLHLPCHDEMHGAMETLFVSISQAITYLQLFLFVSLC